MNPADLADRIAARRPTPRRDPGAVDAEQEADLVALAGLDRCPREKARALVAAAWTKANGSAEPTFGEWGLFLSLLEDLTGPAWLD